MQALQCALIACADWEKVWHHKGPYPQTTSLDVQFGSNYSKESVYTAVLGAFNTSLASGGSLKGVLFWRWSEDGGSDQTTVETGDSIYQYAHVCN